jgi:hypothetical protein
VFVVGGVGMIALLDNIHVGALESTGAVMEGVLIQLAGALDSVMGTVEEGVLIDGVDKSVWHGNVMSFRM